MDEDALSPAGLVAGFTAVELAECRRETFRAYNGLVLARAVAIVQSRLRCFSRQALARKLQIGHTTIHRWSAGAPVSDRMLERRLLELAALLLEEEQSRTPPSFFS